MNEVQIKTGEFEYINVASDASEEQIDQAIETFQNLKTKWEGGAGMPNKEWLRFQENVLTTEGNHIEDFEQMNKAQRWWYNETKKALNRLRAKQN